MTEQLTARRQAFRDHFGYDPDPDFDSMSVDPERYDVTPEETVMFLDPDVSSWGAIELADYHDHDGWRMPLGYADIEGDTKSVYAFDTGSRFNRFAEVVVQKDLLDAVAEVCDTTPADLARDVEVHRLYPPVYRTDGGTFVIAPVGSATDVEYDD